jgi:hypothetical protein
MGWQELEASGERVLGPESKDAGDDMETSDSSWRVKAWLATTTRRDQPHLSPCVA